LKPATKSLHDVGILESFGRVLTATPSLSPWCGYWRLVSHVYLIRKFGKQLQKRQLEIPEYAASFVNYKALKKVRALYSMGAAFLR
jgi:hypothetical protein